ncbi:matrixin family metalloprotease [Hymenobacter guriensis]|uniref:Matrixin family metalloprotease n=1 Tax=Hymenobacter guriensis TaxID=2793065 RepID=A0ABS0KZK7_9BACT|nr:matrixin family metalloprotease [Hymenobacter guriensis]MBG8553140.1 matrixin family metalloprotease [Hymenobacter guriensis]
MLRRFLSRLLAAVLCALTCGPVARAQPAQVAPGISEAHCLLIPLDPAVRAAQASLIVEGEVLDAHGFWDARHRRIYTAHRLRIYKVWKGAVGATITVLTEGGTVGLNQQILTNTLRLTPGEQGVFFLAASSLPGTGASGSWMAYGSEQGVIRYSLAEGTATETFRQYGRISPDFYAQVQAQAGNGRARELQANLVLNTSLSRTVRQARQGQAVVATLSPLSITAGTGAVLTISGSGFGGTRGSGYVAFKNADDGGKTEVKPQDSDYVSWTDTQIRVKVPSFSLEKNTAGSGPVKVVSNTQEEALSAETLTVVYAVSTVQASTNEIVRPNHINDNDRGGYTFQPVANFTSRAGAADAFRRALTTWRCQTGVNWELGTQRTGKVADEDDANSLGFDNENQLPARVLGRTTSYYEGCRRPNGSVVFTVKEIDMVFDDAQSWQFGPAAPTGNQFDFESVVVHELGHAQQLSHLILPGAIMHYAIGARQVSRELNPASEVAGGRFVLRSRSFRSLGCSARPMLPAPLVTVAPETITAGQVNVAWTTTDECFVQEFVVERSADTTNWIGLGRVASTGGPTYQLLDAQAPGGLVYYRIGLVRPSGETDYTGPQLVTDGSVAVNQLKLYPNPVSAGITLQVQILADKGATLVLRLYDATGRKLSVQATLLQAGYNVLPLQLPPGLRSGWYLVRWDDQVGHRGAVPLVLLGP